MNDFDDNSLAIFQDFFREGESIVMQISIVMLIFPRVFGKNLGGQKSLSGGQTALGVLGEGAPPCGRKPAVMPVCHQNDFSHHLFSKESSIWRFELNSSNNGQVILRQAITGEQDQKFCKTLPALSNAVTQEF